MPFDGEVLRVKIMVKEFAMREQGVRLYTVQTVEILKPASIAGILPQQKLTQVYVPPAGFNERFAQMVDAVKSGMGELFSKRKNEQPTSRVDQDENNTYDDQNGQSDLYHQREQRPDTKEAQRDVGRSVFSDVLGAYASRSGATLLGYRLARDVRERSGTELIGQTARTAEDLAVRAQVLRDPRFETFRIFYAKAGKIIGHTGITSRLPGAVQVVHIRKIDPENDAGSGMTDGQADEILAQSTPELEAIAERVHVSYKRHGNVSTGRSSNGRRGTRLSDNMTTR